MTRTEMADRLWVAVFPSDLGWIAVAGERTCIVRLTFGHKSPRIACQKLAVDAEPDGHDAFMAQLIERLQSFSRGDRSDSFIDLELAMGTMTEFQRTVTEQCREIPAGQTCSYGELAALAGRPAAARAVGRVMATNRFPLIVPCHRVVAAGGAIGGFSSPDGISMKRRLLRPELTRAI